MSPRHTAVSQRSAAAKAASNAVKFAWMSLRIRIRIGDVRRVQLSIDEAACGCTKQQKPEWSLDGAKSKTALDFPPCFQEIRTIYVGGGKAFLILNSFRTNWATSSHK